MVPATSNEKMLAQLRKDFRANSVAHYLQAAHHRYEARADSERLRISLLGSFDSLGNSIAQGSQAMASSLSSVQNSVYSLHGSISSLGGGINNINHSINIMGNAFMKQLLKAEENDERRHLQLESKVKEVVSSISILSLHLMAQTEVILDGFKMEEQMLSNLIKSVDELHQTAKHPLQTQSRELFNRGLTNYLKKLFPEAEEDFQKAIEKHRTEPLAHYFLAKIYLYGSTDEESLVDFDKAIEELLLTIRYLKPDIGKSQDINLLYADVSQQLAYAYYLKAKLEESRI